MDWSIASVLLLDGASNGAIYALLGLATVLVFTVDPGHLHSPGRVRRIWSPDTGDPADRQSPGDRLVVADPGQRGGADERIRRVAAAPPGRECAQGDAAHARNSGGGGAGHRLDRAAPAAPGAAGPAERGGRHRLRSAGVPRGVPVAGPCQHPGAADRLGRRALRHDRPGTAVLRRRGLSQSLLLGHAHPDGSRSPSRDRPSSSALPRWS